MRAVRGVHVQPRASLPARRTLRVPREAVHVSQARVAGGEASGRNHVVIEPKERPVRPCCVNCGGEERLRLVVVREPWSGLDEVHADGWRTHLRADLREPLDGVSSL